MSKDQEILNDEELEGIAGGYEYRIQVAPFQASDVTKLFLNNLSSGDSLVKAADDAAICYGTRAYPMWSNSGESFVTVNGARVLVPAP